MTCCAIAALLTIDASVISITTRQIARLLADAAPRSPPAPTASGPSATCAATPQPPDHIPDNPPATR